MIKTTVFSIVLFLVLFSCEYKDSAIPKYKCDLKNPPHFSELLPILLAKCSISGCHDGSRPSIPTLISQAEFKRNASDSKDQIMSGAMPPSGNLTALEKAKIICWIDSGAN